MSVTTNVGVGLSSAIEDDTHKIGRDTFKWSLALMEADDRRLGGYPDCDTYHGLSESPLLVRLVPILRASNERNKDMCGRTHLTNRCGHGDAR